MKKLLTAIVFVLGMSANVFAADSVEKVIENGVRNGQTTIDVSMCNTSPQEVVDAFTKMYGTNIAFDRLDGTFDCKYSSEKALSITVGYVNSPVSPKDAQKAVDKAAADIAKAAKDKTTAVDKVKFVHNYLITNSVYDYTFTSTTVYDLLLSGKGTCGAYTLAFKAIMDKLGIECVVVPSNDKSHAWNQVKIDGKWYNIDVTWDENYTRANVPDSTFLLKSDKYFRNTMHHDWTSANVCSADL